MVTALRKKIMVEYRDWRWLWLRKKRRPEWVLIDPRYR